MKKASTAQHGFTLIELLIAVLIAAILATLAYPSFEQYMRRTRLASVRVQMLENAQRLERFYSQNRTFEKFPESDLIQNEFFDISFFKEPAKQNPNASGFLLQAVANESNSSESCIVYFDDSGIFWANSSTQNCPGYEQPSR